MDPTSDPCSDLNASTPAIRPGADCRRSDRWILAKTKSVLSKTRWTDSAVSTYALAPINISAHLRVTRKY